MATPNRTASTGVAIRNPLQALELRHPMPETGVASARWHEHLGRLAKAREDAGQPPLTEEQKTALWTVYRLAWSDARDFGLKVTGREARAAMGGR